MFYSFLLLDFLWFTFRFQQGPRSVPWEEKSPRYEFDRHQQGGAAERPDRRDDLSTRKKSQLGDVEN